MPELPEVETARLGLTPHLEGQQIRTAIVRNPNMRWPVPKRLASLVAGKRVEKIERRAKYLLIRLTNGTLILHLGMSGSLRIVPAELPPALHDHFDLVLENGKALRLRDPRRFGAVLWEAGPLAAHKLLKGLAPEPFDDSFNAKWLFDKTRGRSAPIKNVLMDNRIVCGVGNIYASESLFRAGIHPLRAAGRISLARYQRLVDEIRNTLADAIRAGGSTLRDFTRTDGSAGYFQHEHLVYDREGEPCKRCARPLRSDRTGQRSTYYCTRCQR